MDGFGYAIALLISLLVIAQLTIIGVSVFHRRQKRQMYQSEILSAFTTLYDFRAGIGRHYGQWRGRELHLEMVHSGVDGDHLRLTLPLELPPRYFLELLPNNEFWTYEQAATLEDDGVDIRSEPADLLALLRTLLPHFEYKVSANFHFVLADRVTDLCGLWLQDGRIAMRIPFADLTVDGIEVAANLLNYVADSIIELDINQAENLRDG